MSIEAAKLMVNVGADTSDAEQGVQSFDQKLKGVSKGLAATGGMLSLAVTAPLLGIAKTGLDSAMDFEQSMNIMAQVTGSTEAQMASLEAQALKLGAETSFSAGEAADAMLELGKAGMDAADIGASIAGVMDLAAAGGVSLAEAAGLTASTLNAFSMEASESTRVANIMAATANASAADISDLGAGMKQAGFAFSMANQPVENLAASLAILTNVGLTGSDAGTALKNAFMRMMNPTEEAKGVMTDLGISFYDAAGQMKMLPEIIDMLNTATAGLTNEQRDAALATLFLSDGMKAFIPLMDAGKEGFNEMITEVSDGNAATEVAAARMGGLSGAIEYLKGSIDSFLIGAATPFLDTISGWVRGVADAVSGFGELPQPLINAGLAFAAVLAAAGPLMLAVSGLVAAFSFLIGPVGLVVVAVGALAAAWAADVGGIQAITATVATSVSTELSKLSTEVSNVATGIAAAFSKTKFPSLDDLWKDFQAGDFNTLATRITSTAYELMVNLDTELNITAKAQQLKQSLVDAVNSMSTAVANVDFSGAASKLNGLRDGILNGIKAAVDGVNWTGAGNTFRGLVDGIKLGIQTLDLSGINWVDTFTNLFLGPAKIALMGLNWVIGSDAFQGLAQSVANAMRALQWGEIGGSLAGLSQAVGSQMGLVAKDMVTDVTAAINEVDFTDASMKISDGISKIGVAISEMDWSNLGTEFAQGLKGLGNSFKGLFTGERNIAAAFDQAVRDAFAEVNFGQLQVAMQGLSASVDKAFLDFASGVSAELNLKTPQWVTNFQTFVVSTPPWLVTLTTWNPTTPGWVSLLMAWTLKQPEWLNKISTWEIKMPAWITELTGWEAEQPAWLALWVAWTPLMPAWVGSIIAWVAAEPSWYSGLLGWQATEPLWLAGMIAWAALEPSWLAGMLSWVATEPGWISRMLNWVASRPGWLDALLNWTPPAITMPGGSTGGGGGGGGGGGAGGGNDPAGTNDSPGLNSGGSGVGTASSVASRMAPLTPRGQSLGQSLAAAAEGINITIYATISNDMDLHEAAYTIGRQVRAGMR